MCPPTIWAISLEFCRFPQFWRPTIYQEHTMSYHPPRAMDFTFSPVLSSEECHSLSYGMRAIPSSLPTEGSEKETKTATRARPQMSMLRILIRRSTLQLQRALGFEKYLLLGTCSWQFQHSCTEPGNYDLYMLQWLSPGDVLLAYIYIYIYML